MVYAFGDSIEGLRHTMVFIPIVQKIPINSPYALQLGLQALLTQPERRNEPLFRTRRAAWRWNRIFRALPNCTIAREAILDTMNYIL